MLSPEVLSKINAVAYELSLQGRPEREALNLVMDPRKAPQLADILKAVERRGFTCVGECA